MSVSEGTSKRSGFFNYIPVDHSLVADIARRAWDVKITKCVKASQNHTFEALDAAGNVVMVRVTPDPASTEAQRVDDEIHFIEYLRSHGLRYVCCPVRSLSGDAFVRESDVLVVVFEYAKGGAVNFADWKWIGDQLFAKSWGRWTGQLHILCRQYASEFQDRVARARSWDDMHGGVMKGAPLDSRDTELMNDPRRYGIGHGDINISNFFWAAPGPEEEYGHLYVFDWDQVQTSWFTYDLAMCVYFPYMLSRAGSFLDGSAVPGKEAADQFKTWVCDGYDSALAGGEKVDREALDRMVLLRRKFYDRMCRGSLSELQNEPDQNKLKDMEPTRIFMQWVVDWLDREAAA